MPSKQVFFPHSIPLDPRTPRCYLGVLPSYPFSEETVAGWGGAVVKEACPARLGLLPTQRKTRGGVLVRRAGRSAQAQWPLGRAEEAPSSTPDAISLPETGLAVALAQEALLRPPPAAVSPASVASLLVARLSLGRRATFGVPLENRRRSWEGTA